MTSHSFPTSLFPQPIRTFIESGAKSIGCDEVQLALPILCVGGGILGGSRRLQIKSCWQAPPILWGCILGESGTQKSPALRLVLAPLRDLQEAQLEARPRANPPATWLPWRPAPAQEKGSANFAHARRILVADATTEALAPIAQENPRGLLLARDELAAFFGGFDRYASTSGGDESFFLSAFDGESVIVDRKKEREHIFVPSLALSIIGTCQPAIFSRLMNSQRRAAGMLARFLVVQPTNKMKRWSDSDVPSGIVKGWKQVIDRLIELDLAKDEEGHAQPLNIGRTPLAHAAYREFFNAHNQIALHETGDWRAFLSKAEQLPLRLSLILHHFEWACGAGPTGAAPDDAFDVAEVNERTMNNAITMTHWFIEEAHRVYDVIDTKPEERLQDELEDYIRKHDGAMTIRDLLRGPRRFRVGAPILHLLLTDLARQGRGQWEYVHSTAEGGLPTSVFRVN